MTGYIQTAIAKIKSVDLEEMRALRKKGHRTIRFRLERQEAVKGKKPATATVPLMWLVETREKHEAGGRKDDAAFNGFISDWISGWV